MVIREVLVVVHHREPRVEHLLSLWHQLGKSKTLSEYILDEHGGLSKSAFKLNSMGLADVFVQEGLPVHIVDTAGAKRMQVDLSTGVVCHALQLPDALQAAVRNAPAPRCFPAPRCPPRSLPRVSQEQFQTYMSYSSNNFQARW